MKFLEVNIGKLSDHENQLSIKTFYMLNITEMFDVYIINVCQFWFHTTVNDNSSQN